MLPPNYLSYCTDEIEEIYSKLDTRITQDIVRRIIKTGEITDTAKWQVKMAQESGLLYDDIVQMVVESTGETEEAVKLLFEDAGIQATMIDYEKAGVLQRVDKLSPSALQILEAAIKKTNSSLSNLTMTTAEMAQNAFISACSMAEMEITSGAFDANTAIKHAVDMSIEEGNRIRYPSGVTRSIEAAVRTAVLTGVSQTTGHISLANAEALGTDIMQLSAHGGARPEHAVWQGKLVCISNKRRRGYLSLKDIGYGEITGFKGINCTHDWYPFIVGVSKRAYTKKELEEINNQTVTYNGKEMPLYEAQDLQRAMERKIRDERRQLASYDTAIKNTKDKTLKQEFQGEFDMLSVKLKSHEAKYRDFSNQTGMRPQTERLQVSGFGRSVSQKAKHSAQEHYDVWRKSIGAEDTPKTLEKYYDMKYNNKYEYELLQGYAKAVKKGDISPLIGFDVYKDVAKNIEKSFIGKETSDGNKIRSFATHFIDRTIGQTSTSHDGLREAATIENSLDALINGTPSPQYIVKVKKGSVIFDDIRQSYSGSKAKVSFSVTEGRLIQTNPFRKGSK